MMISSCATSAAVKVNISSNEALTECTNYCKTSSTLSYRNKNTYFCECAGGEIVVVGMGGTIYK